MTRQSLDLKSLLGLNRLRSNAWLVFGLLTVQQIVVALSSVYLVVFLSALQNGQPWHQSLWLYLLCVVFPFFPGFVSIFSNQIWIAQCQRDLWESIRRESEGQTSNLFDSNRKAQFAPIIKEMSVLLEEVCRFAFFYYPLVLNFLLNSLVVGKLLGGSFVLTFALGFGVSSFQILLAAKYGSKLAGIRQAALAEVDRHFSISWQTLVLRNRPHFAEFEKASQVAEHNYRGANFNSALFENGTAMSLFILSISPTLLLIFQKASAPTVTTQEMIALGALLPRIFQIFTVSSNVLSSGQQIFSYKGRLNNIVSRLVELHKAGDIDQRIHYSKLKLVNETWNETRSLPLSDMPSHGIWRLMGENGSGKSSLMLKLKAEIGEPCYYLPTHSDEFAPQSQKASSTGQKKLSELNFILENVSRYKVILLDEWDANLDISAKARASETISQLAATVIVIETRHTP